MTIEEIKAIIRETGYLPYIRKDQPSATGHVGCYVYACDSGDGVKRSLGPLTQIAVMSKEHLQARVAEKFAGIYAPKEEAP